MGTFQIDSASAERIKKLFGDRLFVAPTRAGLALGIEPQTSYGRVSRGEFPVRLTNVGGRKMVALPDFVNFLLGRSEPVEIRTVIKTKKRGRPTKKEQSARAKAGGAQ